MRLKIQPIYKYDFNLNQNQKFGLFKWIGNLIATLIYSSLCCSNEPLTVQLPGTQTRSFCYVSDMVSDIFVHFSCTTIQSKFVCWQVILTSVEGWWPY